MRLGNSRRLLEVCFGLTSLLCDFVKQKRPLFRDERLTNIELILLLTQETIGRLTYIPQHTLTTVFRGYIWFDD